MEKYTEVTKEEYNFLKRIKRQYEFDPNDLATMVNFSRKYINRQTPHCISCSGSIRETKNNVASYYLMHQDYFELKFESGVEVIYPTKMEQSEVAAEQYIKSEDTKSDLNDESNFEEVKPSEQTEPLPSKGKKKNKK